MLIRLYFTLTFIVFGLNTKAQSYVTNILCRFGARQYIDSTIGQPLYDISNGSDYIADLPYYFEGDLILGGKNSVCTHSIYEFWNSSEYYLSQYNNTVYSGPIEIIWNGKGIYEKGYERVSGTTSDLVQNVPYPSGSITSSYYPYAKVWIPLTDNEVIYTIDFSRTRDVYYQTSTTRRTDKYHGSLIIRRRKKPSWVLVNHYYNKENTNEVFLNRGDTLKTSKTAYNICADGSSVSVFRVNLLDNGINNKSVGFRIRENKNKDKDLYGEFSSVRPLEEHYRLEVTYTHPNYIVSDSSNMPIIMDIFLKDYPDIVIKSCSLFIYRSPIVMAHGLWSKSSSFSEMYKQLINSKYYKPFQISIIDYSSTNNEYFKVNVPKINNAITQHINKLKTYTIAAGKVDFIGHSMGGILGRLYQQSDQYADDIHKIITINTPHSGSEMANIFNSVLGIAPAMPYTLNNFICLFREVFNNTLCNGGAIEDLRVTSDAIRKDLNGAGKPQKNIVPSHAIITTFGETLNRIDDDVQNAEFALTPMPFQYGYPPVTVIQYVPKMVKTPNLYGLKAISDFAGQVLFGALFRDLDHDLIVSEKSQSGGLPAECTTLVRGQMHMGSPANYKVIEHIRNLLETNPQNFKFCKTGFNPEIINLIPFKSEIHNKALENASITVKAPVKGNWFRIGQTILLQVQGTGIVQTKTIVQSDFDSLYVANGHGDNAFYYINVGTTSGTRQIITLGKTATGTIVADTSYFFVTNQFCQSISSGDWNAAGTWSCGRIPTINDYVIIMPTHTVSISTPTATANIVSCEINSRIRYTNPKAKLTVKGGGIP